MKWEAGIVRTVEAGSDRRGAPPAAAQPFHEEEPRPSPLLPIAGCASKIGMLARASLAIVACLAASFEASPTRAQTLTDLGTLPGG